MRRILAFAFCILPFLIAGLFLSCQKPSTSTTVPTNPLDTSGTNPTDTTKNNPPIDTTVYEGKNEWECQIDGVSYKGTIDTSFFTVINLDRSEPDTVVDCNGTTYDKKANIHFRVIINRRIRQNPISTAHRNGLFVFDTLSPTFWIASDQKYQSKMLFSVDSFTTKGLLGTFNGTVESNGGSNLGIRTVTNGKFSCAFGKGNNEPKHFSFKSGSSEVAGFVHLGSFSDNSLVLYGFRYSYAAEQSFRLVVHTGSTIKPGVYTTKKGQVGLALFSPDPSYYASDSIGDLTVIISQVNGSVVTGSFAGRSGDGPITSGLFSCRIKGYQPYADSANKWKWTDQNVVRRTQMIYGGNVLNATRTKMGYRYFLTIKGESNNLTSDFHLTISSFAPIDTGEYYVENNSSHSVTRKILDTLYYRQRSGASPVFDKESTIYHYCFIDSIDGERVVGRITLNPPNSQLLKTGSFTATFR